MFLHLGKKGFANFHTKSLRTELPPDLASFGQVMYKMFLYELPVNAENSLTEILTPSQDIASALLTISESGALGPIDAAKLFDGACTADVGTTWTELAGTR